VLRLLAPSGQRGGSHFVGIVQFVGERLGEHHFTHQRLDEFGSWVKQHSSKQ